MRKFFKGWRRKWGCATLTVAGAFLGLWVRSDYMQDQFFSPVVRRTQLTLISYDRRLTAFVEFDSAFPPDRAPDWRALDISKQPVHAERPPYERNWHWRWLGVDATTTTVTFTGARIPVVHVSHISICLPLTLLSAYLILWPRPKGAPHA